MKRKIISILLVLIILFSGCNTDTSRPEDTVERFAEALTDCDLEGMSECFEPTIAKKMMAMVNLSNTVVKAFTGMDMDASTLSLLIPTFAPLLSTEEEIVTWPRWSFSDYETTINDDTAEVKANVEVDVSGKTEYYNAVFYLIKIEGEWYISDMK